MEPSSSAIDWETLKPKILSLLSEGRNRKDVIEEISKDGFSITKSQLEYQLKCWGRRTNLSEQAWRYANHKVQKRARSKKISAVFFNGALIPREKVVKETRRHDRPTLISTPGSSPECPEGFDLVVCTPPSSEESPPGIASVEVQHSPPGPTRTISPLPWLRFIHELRRNLVLPSMGSQISILRLSNVKHLTPSQFPATLTDSTQVEKLPPGVKKLDTRHFALSDWSESDQTSDMDAVSRGGITYDSQLDNGLERLIFQISNKLSEGNSIDDWRLLGSLSHMLKIVAKSSSSWRGLLTHGRGPTSRSLIEQLFKFSIIAHDRTLANLLLQIGADPNQEIEERVSALDLAVRLGYTDIVDLLFNAGAVCGQTTLMHVVIAGDFDTADRMLQSDISLDLNFNYVDEPDLLGILNLGPLKVETVTLVGLMCFRCTGVCCYCDHPTRRKHFQLTRKDESDIGYGIDKLKYLLERHAAITLDTMILASLSADATALQLLMQHGGETRGTNRFGFSCLAAASLREKLQYDIFDLLCSQPTIDVLQTHNDFGWQASPIHWLCLHQRANHHFETHELGRIMDLLIKSGGNINYHIRHQCSSSQLREEKERFLWSRPSQYSTTIDPIAQAKAESPLECAIIARNERIALDFVSRGCHFTGHEIKLAVKFGLLSLLQTFLHKGPWVSDGECIRRTCLRLALRWGRDIIVRFLLGEGVRFGEHDMIDALQYPGRSILSTDVQICLIRSTPNMERGRIFDLSLLELCFLKFTKDAVTEILRLHPTAYDSGALYAIVIRALKASKFNKNGFRVADIQTMLSRRTEHNSDWEKENTALLLAAMFNRPDIVRLLVTPGTAYVLKTARLPRTDFAFFLDPECRFCLYDQVDPTHGLGCQDWVACSPLMGIATTPYSVSEDILDHLLACSYEPDALTVVVAAANGHLHLLRRFQHLENWRSIVSIDNDDRPPWCPTALQVAALEENEKLVEFLLETGVSVNERPASEPTKGLMPRTALQAAIHKGNLTLTNLFIVRGACINAPAAEDSGATALQLACIHGYLEISLRLLELGADVNAPGAQKHGRTALEGAAEYGRIDTIQLLLDHGACTDGPYRAQYLNAVLYAEHNQHFAAADLLREHRKWTSEDQECYESLQSDELYEE